MSQLLSPQMLYQLPMARSFETDNFNAGLRPAMSPGISVSRVGGSAQVPYMKKLSGGVKQALAAYRELAAFLSLLPISMMPQKDSSIGGLVLQNS